MHVAYVCKDGQKMSKSLGNLVFVSELREKYDPRAIRLAVIEHHYRDRWEWDDGLVDRATERLKRWQYVGGRDTDPALLDEVRRHLDNDLFTPGVVAALDRAAASSYGVDAAAALLGVNLG